MLLAFPGTLRPAQSPFPQGWRISVILKISALHPIQATRSGVFRGFLFSGPYPKAVNRHIINILIILHPFHPFSRNPRVSRDTLRGCGKSEYEPMIRSGSSQAFSSVGPSILVVQAAAPRFLLLVPEPLVLEYKVAAKARYHVFTFVGRMALACPPYV